MWDLPEPGLEPVSPALAGGFLTTVPPGKPCLQVFTSFSLLLFVSPAECFSPTHEVAGTEDSDGVTAANPKGHVSCVSYTPSAAAIIIGHCSSLPDFRDNTLRWASSCLLPLFHGLLLLRLCPSGMLVLLLLFLGALLSCYIPSW